MNIAVQGYADEPREKIRKDGKWEHEQIVLNKE